MGAYTLQALSPKTRCFVTVKSSVPFGKNKNGTPHYNFVGIEYFETESAGKIRLEKWFKYFKEAVRAENKEKLFSAICDYCRKNCAWLKTDEDVDVHAAECLCHGSYLHWKDFDYKEG